MTLVFFLLAAVWCLVLILWYLEYRRIRRDQDLVSIRIGITGTRGKSSLVRLLAGAFRANGLGVLAKTSGSEACLILPDGTDRPIIRCGMPTILEQKQVLRAAARRGCGTLICEVMSIRPEYQGIESSNILGLTHCVVSNCRIDHPEQGDSKDSVAACLSRSIPAGGVVFCPSSEVRSALSLEAEKREATLVTVDDGAMPDLSDLRSTADHVEFQKNIALALAVCAHFGLSERLSLDGMFSAVGDVGALRSWRLGKDMLCVNAFAANDIESTRMLLDRLPAGRRIGLLNFRKDRPERTQQFIDAILSGVFSDIEMFFCIGAHGEIVRRKIRGICEVVPLRSSLSASAVMTGIRSRVAGVPFQLIGMGNIAGKPMELLGFWESEGSPYGL